MRGGLEVTAGAWMEVVEGLDLQGGERGGVAKGIGNLGGGQIPCAHPFVSFGDEHGRTAAQGEEAWRIREQGPDQGGCRRGRGQ